jgi:glutaredoxin
LSDRSISPTISPSTPTPPPTITLYSRPGCHLCDDARAALERVRAKATFSLREVDITSDDSLHTRYLERIPVVALGDEELFDFFVDEAALEAKLYRLPR